MAVTRSSPSGIYLCLDVSPRTYHWHTHSIGLLLLSGRKYGCNFLSEFFYSACLSFSYAWYKGNMIVLGCLQLQLQFLAIFVISCCSMFAKQLLLFFCQISPLLSSPLLCRWWNCTSPNIIWNMSWWSRTCEELGIISSHLYITFSSFLCYDALML